MVFTTVVKIFPFQISGQHFYSKIFQDKEKVWANKFCLIFKIAFHCMPIQHKQIRE